MKNYLVCVDGSSYSQVCCQYAAWFAKKSKAHLNVVYVSELNPLQNPLWADLGGSLGIDPFQDFSSKLELIEKEKVKIIESNLDETFKTLRLPKTQYTFHHHYNQLTDVVEEFETDKTIKKGMVDVVFLGKRGENANLAKGHLGSSLERVVRASIKPCLVTSRSFNPVKTIAIATDNSPSVQKALEFLKKSPMFSGCKLHIISVAESKKDKYASEYIDQAHAQLKKTYKSITCKELSGPVENKISNYVKRNKVDLLIMGAYGHSRIRSLLIGSTTTLLIQSCKIPILLFR